jgi:uncharacterized membrane protein
LQPVMQFVYFGGEVGPVSILYTLVPWIGVMVAGYAFGALLLQEPATRDRALFRIGIAATAAFIVLAAVSVVVAGDQRAPAWMQMLNQRKYPASQLFLLMTLGPAIAAMPLLERVRNRAIDALATFGRVPMFYYLLHIPVIHTLALVVWLLRDGTTHGDWFVTAPYVSIAREQQWSLGLLYFVFAVAVTLLYFPCRWYASQKARRHASWMQYL